MAKYKPVKIMFNIEDEHQSNLYKYLKDRSNSSSFIRTLLFQEMNKPTTHKTEQIEVIDNSIVDDEDDIVLDDLL